MTWLDDFYLSENITDSRGAIKRKINWNRNVLEYYLLTVPKNKSKVDIIPALEFKSMPNEKKNNMLIVGVSNGYHNAMKMVDEISENNLLFG